MNQIHIYDLSHYQIIQFLFHFFNFRNSQRINLFPVFIKDFGLSIIKKIENNKFTTNFSNIGKISFCDEVDDKIESVTAMISSDSFQFVACTFKDNFCITISNCYIDNDIIKNYCRYLVENGLDINIISSEVSI